MARTFAEHILNSAAKGHASAVRAPQSACAAKKTVGATYASVVLTMAIGAAGPVAQAATDGVVALAGNSSSAKLGLSLVIPERIEAQGFHSLHRSEVSDMNVGAPNGSASGARQRVGQIAGCVFGRGSSQYGVSQPPGSPYRLKLVAGAADCGPNGSASETNNAWLEVSRLEGQNTESTYSQALTLLITPE